jgi:hypothetical protein
MECYYFIIFTIIGYRYLTYLKTFETKPQVFNLVIIWIHMYMYKFNPKIDQYVDESIAKTIQIEI